RVRDVMSAPVATVAGTVSLATVIDRMARERISSLLVTGNGEAPLVPAHTGIITERDTLRALAAHGAGALQQPVANFASRPLIAVPAAAFVYRALGRMSRLRLRHLGVENESGEICGIITARDLLRLRAQEATVLGDALDQGDDVPALAAAWALLPQAAAALQAESLGG